MNNKKKAKKVSVKKESKNPKTKSKQQTPDIEEVLKSQISIYQFCHVLQAENSDLKLKVQKLSDQMLMAEQSHQNLKRFLEIIAEKIQELKARMMEENGDHQESEPEPQNEQKSQQVESKPQPPLHDDVTIQCEVCSKVHHAKITKCPNCGYERNKKGKK
jgi:uncharacterized protein (DUF3084 family)